MDRNLILAAVCLLTIASCSKGGRDQALQGSSIRQIDVTEVVPVHNSSLDYFDFVFKYMDNLGREEEVTVRDGSSLSNGCYVKTYSYKGCPVACTAIVELVPKVPRTDVVSFTFIKPKPYMLPRVIFSSNGGTPGIDGTRPEGYEDILIESMSVDEFLSTYGTTFFTNTMIVDSGDGGVECFSY